MFIFNTVSILVLKDKKEREGKNKTERYIDTDLERGENGWGHKQKYTQEQKHKTET